MILPSRLDPGAIQLSARVPRELHARFYAACRYRGVSGSDMFRFFKESFMRVTREAEHGPL